MTLNRFSQLLQPVGPKLAHSQWPDMGTASPLMSYDDTFELTHLTLAAMVQVMPPLITTLLSNGYISSALSMCGGRTPSK